MMAGIEIVRDRNTREAYPWEQRTGHRVVLEARKRGLNFDIMLTSFFLSRRSVRPDPKSGMPVWQDRLFIILAKNADDASSYFQLPTDRVVEIGTQVTV